MAADRVLSNDPHGRVGGVVGGHLALIVPP
jgi:hypothetical protein